MAVFSELEGALHVALYDVEGQRDLGQLPLRILELTGDSALFLGEEIDRHRVGVVQMEELAPLIGEARDPQLLDLFPPRRTRGA